LLNIEPLTLSSHQGLRALVSEFLGKVIGAELVNVFWLRPKDFPVQVLEDLGEAKRNSKLLGIKLVCHFMSSKKKKKWKKWERHLLRRRPLHTKEILSVSEDFPVMNRKSCVDRLYMEVKQVANGSLAGNKVNREERPAFLQLC
jgi:hypothetical protein